MMSTYLQNAISPALKNKYPNLLRTIGVNTNISEAAESGDLFNLFKLFQFNNKTSNVNFRMPLLTIAGVEDLDFCFLTKIAIQGNTNISEEPIPVIEDNVFCNNCLTQYASLQPITIQYSGKFIENSIQMRKATNIAGDIIKPINALAHSIGVGEDVDLITSGVNNSMETLDSITSQINDTINRAGTVFDGLSKITDAIFDGKFSRLIESESFGVKIQLFIWSCLLLRASKTSIDLNIYNMTFPDFLLQDVNFTLSPDEERMAVDYILTFRHITYIGDKDTPNVLKNSLTTKKFLPDISSIDIK